MIFFISNAIEGQLISTGAFEVAFNGKNVSFFSFSHNNHNLTLLLLNMTCPVLANSVDPDHLASEEGNWSGSALFVIKYVNFYQKPESSNLIGWKLEVGMASKFIQQGKDKVDWIIAPDKVLLYLTTL